MRYCYLLLLIFLTGTSLPGQMTAQKRVDLLLSNQQYAAAHLLLDSLASAEGQPANWHCQRLQNIRENYFHVREGNVFYLRNKDADGNWKSENVAVYRPHRSLEKAVAANPALGCGQFELGMFYLLLNGLGTEATVDNAHDGQYKHSEIQTRFKNAADNGINNMFLNRWLGISYFDDGEVNLALEFLGKNIAAKHQDPLTYLYLAEIFFSKQQYSRCYNYTLQALQLPTPLPPDVRYNALRLAALSLQELGETGRFVEYVIRAIHLFPDEQETYLLLARHFIARRNFEEADKTYRQMLLNNPYDRNGYEQIEKYSINRGDFYFGETILEELAVTFDADEEALALIHEFRGNLLYHQGMLAESEREWDISRQYFRQFLPPDSPQMQLVGEIARNQKSP